MDARTLPEGRRKIWSLWCWLTDHRYVYPESASEPFCYRCGCSDYWPVRRTLGRYLEGVRWWWFRVWWLPRRQRRDDDIPF